ncbi:hypothetical protein BDB00DRAFT_808548 [Zychaea mexicana]|uniref:uncharacterized protein n=1 Tax=Zychaea mexicana TaxID=64656 RepID=UPI0022FEA764|nr:uncharacterized protein BDB00DRAFT_808548 [Zychaea mexicana]KAI9496732.1 hypothetical protein BDB00DRAFT_808548 [Zychaea mexicana]
MHNQHVALLLIILVNVNSERAHRLFCRGSRIPAIPPNIHLFADADAASLYAWLLFFFLSPRHPHASIFRLCLPVRLLLHCVCCCTSLLIYNINIGITANSTCRLLAAAK